MTLERVIDASLLHIQALTCVFYEHARSGGKIVPISPLSPRTQLRSWHLVETVTVSFDLMRLASPWLFASKKLAFSVSALVTALGGKNQLRYRGCDWVRLVPCNPCAADGVVAVLELAN